MKRLRTILQFPRVIVESREATATLHWPSHKREATPRVRAALSTLIGKEHGKPVHRRNIFHCITLGLIQIRGNLC